MVEMAFYWSLFFTQFSDVKRKDFTEMFVHHLATLALLTLSWTTQMHRIGSLVILVHDFADHWMELAKMARYANLNVKNGNKNGKLFTVHIFRASVTSVL